MELEPDSLLRNLKLTSSVDQVKQLLTGVNLPAGLRVQNRVKDGQNINRQFAFQPTWMITSFILNHLVNFPLFGAQLFYGT